LDEEPDQDPEPDPHQSGKPDPVTHQCDADPQSWAPATAYFQCQVKSGIDVNGKFKIYEPYPRI